MEIIFVASKKLGFCCVGSMGFVKRSIDKLVSFQPLIKLLSNVLLYWGGEGALLLTALCVFLPQSTVH